MPRRVGLVPVPDDANLEQFMQTQIDEHDELLYALLSQFQLTIEETIQSGQPFNFAYGKLINFINSDEIPEIDRIKLLSAAVWELAKRE